MRSEKSRLMIYAAIAAFTGVIANLISASVLLRTSSNSWIIFSALAIGASLLAAYVTLIASQRRSLEASKSKGRVFLSYAREDEERIEVIYKGLQAEGFEPWMDVKRLTAGENWIRGIEHAIENSDFLVALISKNSLDKRGFIQKEMKFVLDLLGQKSRRNIRIIPALLDNSKVPEPLTKFHRVNLFEENGFSKLVGALQITYEEGEKQNAS